MPDTSWMLGIRNYVKTQSLTSGHFWGKQGYEQVIPTDHGPAMGGGGGGWTSGQLKLRGTRKTFAEEAKLDLSLEG